MGTVTLVVITLVVFGLTLAAFLVGGLVGAILSVAFLWVSARLIGVDSDLTDALTYGLHTVLVGYLTDETLSQQEEEFHDDDESDD